MKKNETAIIDYSRKWYAMSAVGMGIFMGTIDLSIVNIAMPTLVRELNSQFSTVQWVVLSYLLTITTLMLGIGRISDMIGKKSLYIFGMIIFTIGSLLCAISPNVYWLIGFRVFQGLGSVMLMALGAGIVSDVFPPSERGKSLGIIGSIVSIGIVTGPVLGGLIIDLASWHWIFLVNLPVGVIGIFMSIKFIPYSKPKSGQRFDYTGAILLFISILSLLMGLTMGQKKGFSNRYIHLLFLNFIIFLFIFVRVELRIRNPLINLRLFQRGLLSFNIIMGFFSFFSISGVIFLIPFYLENIVKLNPGFIGILLATIPLSMGVVSPFAGTLSDKYGTWIINIVGLIFILLSYVLATGFNSNTTVPGYIAVFVPLGLGLGTFSSPNNSAIMHSFPREQYGIGSSLLAFTRTLGQTAGVAGLGAFWAFRVSHYSGGLLKEGPSKAEVKAQIAGLHDVFIISTVLIFMALVLAVTGFKKSGSLKNNP